jgi:hypothetical protein
MSAYQSAAPVLLAVLAAAPWAVPAALLWRGRIRDGALTPSMGELARRRWMQ